MSSKDEEIDAFLDHTSDLLPPGYAWVDWKDRRSAEQAVAEQLLTLGLSLDLDGLAYDRKHVGLEAFFHALGDALEPRGWRVNQMDTGADDYVWSIEPIPGGPQLLGEIPLPAYLAPEPGERWVHRNGNVYDVVAITNLPDEERYPKTVVYRNVDNGTMWSRRYADWHRSFKLAPRAINPWDVK